MAAKKFTKADIVDALYEKTKLSRSDIKTALDLLIEEIKDALLRRETIEIRGLGTFQVYVRKAKPNARNPKTGEPITINSRGAVSFRLGKELKQAVRAIKDEQV